MLKRRGGHWRSHRSDRRAILASPYRSDLFLESVAHAVWAFLARSEQQRLRRAALRRRAREVIIPGPMHTSRDWRWAAPQGAT